MLAGRPGSALQLLDQIPAATVDSVVRADASLTAIQATLWGPSGAQKAVATASADAARVASVDPSRAAAHLAQAAAGFFILGDVKTVLRLAGDAYRLGGPDSLDAVSVLATGLIAAGRHTEAAGLFDGDLVGGLLRQARLGEDLPAHPAVGYLGQSLMFAERHEDAEVLLRATVDGCRRQGVAQALAYPLAALSDLLRRTGRWVEATTCGAEAAALAEETGQSVLGGFAGNCVAWLRAMQGDTAGCDQLVETSFAVAAATGALLLRLHGLAVYGMARLAAGQVR